MIVYMIKLNDFFNVKDVMIFIFSSFIVLRIKILIFIFKDKVFY